MTEQNTNNDGSGGQKLTGGNETVLVLCEDIQNCEELKQLLRFEYDLVVRSNDDAIEAFTDFNIDLIIIDIANNPEGGTETYRALKETFGHRNIPVVFLTELSSPLEDSLLLEEAGIDFVHKPYHPIALLTRIRTSLSIKSSMDVLRRHALLDAHTGIATMHYYRVVFDREWRSALRQKKPLSIMRICIDDHKRYENEVGFSKASVDFKIVAGAIKTSLMKPRDLMAFMQDYEFLCLFPDTDTVGSLHLAEKLRKKVESLAISHATGACQPVITVSIGIKSVIPSEKVSRSGLFNDVITSLQQAQQGGGNQYY